MATARVVGLLVCDRPREGAEPIFDGLKRRAYADSATELCEALIPGYQELADPAEQAPAPQVRGRPASHSPGADCGGIGPAGCSEQEREVLLGPRHVPLELEVWEAHVPLVLVDTSRIVPGVAPWGVLVGERRPHSNLLWLSPTGEASLLQSLADVGSSGLPSPPELAAGFDSPSREETLSFSDLLQRQARRALRERSTGYSQSATACITSSVPSRCLRIYRSISAADQSVWSRMKVEALRSATVANPGGMNAIFEYLEIFHNRHRHHNALQMCTPIEFEQRQIRSVA